MTGQCNNCDNCLNPKKQFEGKDHIVNVLKTIIAVKEKFKADHIANLNFYWQPTETISLVATGKHVSKVYRNKSNTQTIQAYTTVDLRVEQAMGRVSIFGEIENLTDQTYCYADGLLAAPLTWVVGFNWQI
jgi:outer membrane cobalamin receptor